MGSHEVQQIINALSLGALYGLLALGLGMVIGVLNLINFAYGELIAIGGYTMYVLLAYRMSWLIVVPGTVLAVIGARVLLERVAFRPVRGANPVTLLLTSFAVSTVLQNSFLIAVSPRPQVVPTPEWVSSVLFVGPYVIPVVRLLTLGVTLACLAELAFFQRRTDLGMAIRAAAHDFVAVQLMGIRADRVGR